MHPMLTVVPEWDRQYEEVTVTSVESESAGWGLGLSSGWSFYCPKNESGVVPKAGDAARLYGEGIGRPVRGLVINGLPVFYRTPEQQAREEEARSTEYHANKRMAFEENKAAQDADYATLPPEFRARIDRFRRNRADWRWEHEPYELSVCKDAVLIAEQFRGHTNPAEAISTFHESDWEVQKALIPGLFDGHSGNSFGAACFLARLYLERPDLIDKSHGALCPLVGCEDYGCYAAYQEAA